ncbi:hypothetical protein GF314_01705 [bacterium]|nr:hypothetical protein [bacterium]
MHKVKAILIVLTLVIAGSALAACPDQVGVWSSVENGSADYPLLNGRMSEAWCAGTPLTVGNTQNLMSWDGAELGTEWHFYGLEATDIAMSFDGVVDGDGVRIYNSVYENGMFMLGGEGSWTFDDVDLTGAIGDYLVTTTLTYVDGEVVAAVSNIAFYQSAFDECAQDCFIEFGILNTALVWRTDTATAPMPADYPAFLCGATDGELHNASDITLEIQCEVATETSSWSEIKGLYDSE